MSEKCAGAKIQSDHSLWLWDFVFPVPSTELLVTQCRRQHSMTLFPTHFMTFNGSCAILRTSVYNLNFLSKIAPVTCRWVNSIAFHCKLFRALAGKIHDSLMIKSKQDVGKNFKVIISLISQFVLFLCVKYSKSINFLWKTLCSEK